MSTRNGPPDPSTEPVLALPWVVMTWGWTLSVSPPVPPESHHHHAMELIFALDGHVQATLAKDSAVGRAVLIGPNVHHSCKVTGSAQGALLLAPLTTLGDRFRRFLGRRPAKAIPAALADDVIRSLVRQPTAGGVAAEISKLSDRLGAGMTSSQIDSRVDRIVDVLRYTYCQPTPVGTLAERVALSERRLAYLFRRDVGMPVRSYRKWLRLRGGIRLVLLGEDVTWAAHDVGFPDLPDFSRSCRHTLGFSPSLVKRWTPEFVELGSPPDED